MYRINTFGLTKEDIAKRLAGFQDKFPGAKLKIEPKFPEIHLEFSVVPHSKQLHYASFDEIVDWVQSHLCKAVISFDGSSIEVVIGRLLKQKKATLALAESCTGGLIAHRLTNVAGSSDYFLFSGVTYSNDAKVIVLRVSPTTLKQYGAVSEATVKAMAAGAKEIAGATYGLATSGIAGPGGGTIEKPVGTVCIGLAGPRGVSGNRYQFHLTDRLKYKEMFAACALDVLRRELIE